jgi:hypothetical protein
MTLEILGSRTIPVKQLVSSSDSNAATHITVPPTSPESENKALGVVPEADFSRIAKREKVEYTPGIGLSIPSNGKPHGPLR